MSKRKSKAKPFKFLISNAKPLEEIGEYNLKSYLTQSYQHDWRIRKKSIENLSVIDDNRARNRIRDLSFDEATQVRMYASNCACILGITTLKGHPIMLKKMKSLFLLKQMKPFKNSLHSANNAFIGQGITPTYKEFIRKYKEQNPALYDLIDGRCIAPEKTKKFFKDQCRLAKIELLEENAETAL